MQHAPQQSVSGAKVHNKFDKTNKAAEFFQRPDGTVYGWTENGEVYLTQDGVNPNSPLHEYTHLWATAVQRKAPQLWSNIKELLKGTPVWEEVMKDEGYTDIL